MKLSALDLITLTEDQSAESAFNNTANLAKHLDQLGYNRLWFAEHHGSKFHLSSSPEISAAYIAGITNNLKVGTGGTMIMHYSPLKIAENFKTLAAFAPGRVDIGIGRAPGGSPIAIDALAEGRHIEYTDLYEKIKLILRYLADENQEDSLYKRIEASPTHLIEKPTPWLLGSSGNSAMKAGELGVGYSFAKFFGIDNVPDDLFEHYKYHFKPSTLMAEPYSISTYQVVVAETEEEANQLAKPLEINRLLNLQNKFRPILPVNKAQDVQFDSVHRNILSKQYEDRIIIKGTPEQVKVILLDEQEKYGFDEAMIYSPIPNHAKRLNSYTLLYKVFQN